MRHTFNINSDTYRVEWPFFKMKVGDYLTIKGPKAKEVKQRALSAAYHYRESYGKWFKAEEVEFNHYRIVRYL